jgi:hypothetical protein
MFVAEVCLLSLLACGGVGWLWWRSHHGDRPRLGLRLPVTRYTVRTEPGRLTLWGPPPPATAAEAAKAKRAASLLRNRDIRMRVYASVNVRRLYLQQFAGADAETDTPAESLWNADRDAFGPLLEAMEDPARSTAAHVLLCHRLVPARGGKLVVADEGSDDDIHYLEPGPSGTVSINYKGMRVTLWPVRSEIDRVFEEHRAEPQVVRPLLIRMHVRADPAQLPALREHWHDKLDVPLGSAPHWAFVLDLAAPPALWCAARGRRSLRRRRRGRLGLCVACGYDLRNIPVDRCPECGMAARPKGEAA